MSWRVRNELTSESLDFSGPEYLPIKRTCEGADKIKSLSRVSLIISSANFLVLPGHEFFYLYQLKIYSKN